MTATNPTAPTTFTSGGLEFMVNGTLTLGQKEELRGRSLTQYDTETGFHFCVGCLSDLPTDHSQWFDHMCADEPVCLDVPAPPPVVHKTRTVPFPTETPTGHNDWYGQPVIIYGTIAKAFCSCGWKSGWCDDRDQARAEARWHRANPEQAAA